MRNIRTRRRLGFILTSLLIVCVILFIEDRIEAFVPEIKNFAEMKIEAAMGGRVQLSIGDIDGGLIHPFIFNDIKIENGNGVAILPSLKLSSIKTTYRVWDLLRAASLAKNKNGQAVSRLLSGVSRLDINFITVNKKISGFIRLANHSGELNAKGYINLSSGSRIDFDGKMKDGAYDIEVRPKRGMLRVQGTISPEGSLSANFKVYHLDLGGQDLVCDGILKSEITTSGTEVRKTAVQGMIETRNCILNYRPFLNLKASYKIEDGSLFISDLSLGDIFKGTGTFQLREPFNMNAALTVNNLSLSWIALALGAKDASAILSGSLNAKCEFKGPMANLRSNIQMEVRKGTIATLDFECLSAHFKGDGPLMRIDDSRITRESGYFVVAGEMDLRKMGRGSMFEKLRLVGDDKAINWDGWDTNKVQNIREIRMKKRINDDIDLNFKNFTSEDTIDESLKYGDEVQLEYKLHPNDSLKVMVGQDKEFLGLEHKDKF